MNANIFGIRRKSKSSKVLSSEFKLTSRGDFDIEKKRLCRVGSGVEPDDAATLRMLESKIQQLKTHILADVDSRIEALTKNG